MVDASRITGFEPTAVRDEVETNVPSTTNERPAAMITYFVHATSSDNEAGIRSGWNDPPLSVKGRSQAAELREAIAHLHFRVVFSSDLTRALQTAEIVFPEASVRTDERLREMNYGLLNGHPDGDFPDDERCCIGNRFEEGENCLDVQRRVESFLNDNCTLRVLPSREAASPAITRSWYRSVASGADMRSR